MKVALRSLLLQAPALALAAPGGISWGAHLSGTAVGYIVLNQISMTPDQGIVDRLTPTRYRVQIDCYGPSAGKAQAIADEVMAVLDRHSAPPFLGIFMIGASDMLEGDPNQPIHRVSMDFDIVYRG